MGSDYGFVNDLALVSRGEAEFPSHLPKLFMAEPHGGMRKYLLNDNDYKTRTGKDVN